MFQTLLTSLFVLFFGREDHSTLGSLLVVDKASNAVSLVDLDAGKEIAKVPTGNHPHEVAVSPNGQSAVVSNYGAQEPGNSLSW